MQKEWLRVNCNDHLIKYDCCVTFRYNIPFANCIFHNGDEIYYLNCICFHLGIIDRQFNFYNNKRIRAIKECHFLFHFNFRSIKHDYSIAFGPISLWQIAFFEVAISEIDCKKNEEKLPLFVFRLDKLYKVSQ